MKNIVIKPIITEQSMSAAQNGKYTFYVAKDAQKSAIKHDVENTFNVKVTSIVTHVVKGKTKRVGARRNEVKVGSQKKAVVKLAPGQRISLFELGGEAK